MKELLKEQLRLRRDLRKWIKRLHDCPYDRLNTDGERYLDCIKILKKQIRMVEEQIIIEKNNQPTWKQKIIKMMGR